MAPGLYMKEWSTKGKHRCLTSDSPQPNTTQLLTDVIQCQEFKEQLKSLSFVDQDLAFWAMRLSQVCPEALLILFCLLILTF